MKARAKPGQEIENAVNLLFVSKRDGKHCYMSIKSNVVILQNVVQGAAFGGGGGTMYIESTVR
jgi:hypothetical protein